MTTTPQRYVHLSVRTNPRHAARVRDHLGTAPRTGPTLRGVPGPQPAVPGTEARGFVLHVGMDESKASAAGTSLTRLAHKLLHYVESIVPGSQTAAAVSIAPAGAPGTDLEVVHRVLGDPAIQQGDGPELVQAPAPEGTGQPGVVIDLGRREVQLDGQVEVSLV